jgi:hypothetical protein
MDEGERFRAVSRVIVGRARTVLPRGEHATLDITVMMTGRVS